MIKIKKGFVLSEDINRILKGINAYDFKYDNTPNESVITSIRKDFEKDMNKIFDNEVTIVSEEEMLEVNDFIGGEYPHCYSW